MNLEEKKLAKKVEQMPGAGNEWLGLVTSTADARERAFWLWENGLFGPGDVRGDEILAVAYVWRKKA